MNNEELKRKYSEVLRETVRLASEKRHEDDEEELSKGPIRKAFDFNLDDLRYKGKELELFNYLNSQEFETVKVIQTIMYIGRDSFPVEEDGTVSYERFRNNLELGKGWEDKKRIEISQILGKYRLDDYLLNGCKKLGIVL